MVDWAQWSPLSPLPVPIICPKEDAKINKSKIRLILTKKNIPKPSGNQKAQRINSSNRFKEAKP